MIKNGHVSDDFYVTATGARLYRSGAINNWMPSHNTPIDAYGTSRNDVFYAVSGDRMYGGAGDDSYYVWSSNYTITENANSGVDTLYSYAWGSTTLAANVENLVLMGDIARAGNGNALGNIIVAGPISAYLDGKGGDDVIVAGAGRDLINVKAGNGSDAIEDFSLAMDQVRLEGYGLNYDTLTRLMRQDGADVRITLSNREQLVIRGVSVDDLNATHFRFNDQVAFSLRGLATTGESTLTGGGSADQANGWYVHNNAWGAGSLTYGTDYTMHATYDRADMTEGTTFTWSFPDVATSMDGSYTVRGYPEVFFGGSPHAGGYDPGDTAGVFPVRLSDLAAMTATYDVSYSGNTSGFDIAYDLWFTSVPHGDASKITNEVMIWIHQGSFDAWGERVGTYQDGDFAATIYHQNDTNYTAIVANQDVPSGTLDLAKLFAKLGEMGILSSSEYLANVELGAEVVSGSGTFVVNDLELQVTSNQPDGSKVVKTVTGAGTTVDTILPHVDPAPYSFNGDGRSDIFWQHASGAVSVWTSAGSGDTAQLNHATFNASVDPRWTAIDSFDFNGDGTADMLWRHVDGSVAVWTGDKGSFNQTAYNHGPVDMRWSIVGAGDLNGDGFGDLLWRHSDGSIVSWTGTGTGFQENGYYHESVGRGWKVEGLGDFNGDGMQDILWRDKGGAMSIWNSTGHSFEEGSFTVGDVPREWHIKGVGDFNADGRDDILWRNDNGSIIVWEADGAGGFQGVRTGFASSEWSIAQVGDFNGDKHADILWHSNSGEVTIWQGTSDGWSASSFSDTVSPGWQVAAHDFLL